MSLPWDDLADALDRLRAAERAGDVPAAAAAAGDAGAARRAGGLVGLWLLQRAADPDGCGDALAGVLDGLPAPAGVLAEIAGAVGPVRRLAEWCAAEVRRLQAENWELARWVRRLEVEVAELKVGPDAVAQDQGDRGGAGVGRDRRDAG